MHIANTHVHTVHDTFPKKSMGSRFRKQQKNWKALNTCGIAVVLHKNKFIPDYQYTYTYIFSFKIYVVLNVMRLQFLGKVPTCGCFTNTWAGCSSKNAYVNPYEHVSFPVRGFVLT